MVKKKESCLKGKRFEVRNKLLFLFILGIFVLIIFGGSVDGVTRNTLFNITEKNTNVPIRAALVEITRPDIPSYYYSYLTGDNGITSTAIGLTVGVSYRFDVSKNGWSDNGGSVNIPATGGALACVNSGGGLMCKYPLEKRCIDSDGVGYPPGVTAPPVSTGDTLGKVSGYDLFGNFLSDVEDSCRAGFNNQVVEGFCFSSDALSSQSFLTCSSSKVCIEGACKAGRPVAIRVKNSAGTAISLANVAYSGPSGSVNIPDQTTNAAGETPFHSLNTGSWTFTASKANYLTNSLTYTVTAATASITQTITLQPAPTCIDSDNSGNPPRNGEDSTKTKGSALEYTDRCSTGNPPNLNIVVESYCNSPTTATQTTVNCPSGYSCSDGACITQTATCTDADGDGYNNTDSVLAHPPPNAICGGIADCDDSNPNINPGKTEICGNTVDEDCSGSDLACPPGGCTPDSSCAANTCTGSTCTDSCGNSYAGTKSCVCTPDSSCADNTCTGSTCTDSCGNSYAGTKSCACGDGEITGSEECDPAATPVFRVYGDGIDKCGDYSTYDKGNLTCDTTSCQIKTDKCSTPESSTCDALMINKICSDFNYSQVDCVRCEDAGIWDERFNSNIHSDPKCRWDGDSCEFSPTNKLTGELCTVETLSYECLAGETTTTIEYTDSCQDCLPNGICTKDVPCPQFVELPFFGMFGFILSVLVIAGIYGYLVYKREKKEK